MGKKCTSKSEEKKIDTKEKQKTKEEMPEKDPPELRKRLTLGPNEKHVVLIAGFGYDEEKDISF